MWKGERKESPCFSHRWLQESHGHSRPPCFYHSPDARKKNLNPLGSAALLTGKACALPSCRSGNMNVDAHEKQVNTWSTGGRVCVWISGLWLKSETLKSSKSANEKEYGILHRPKCNFYSHPLSFNQSWWHDSRSNCVVSVDAQMRNGLQCVGYTKYHCSKNYQCHLK